MEEERRGRIEEKREEKKDESGSKEEDSFDAVGAMVWEDGIGTLPGSDLKVNLSDLFIDLSLVNTELITGPNFLPM